MKILVVNPNVTESVTELIARTARRAASPGTEIIPVTAPFGVAYLENRSEAIVGAYAVLTVLAERLGGYDAAVVAAFGDPGVDAARELLDLPVVGVSEAAMATACLLGQRFSIIGISRRVAIWYRECADKTGFASRLASIRALDESLGSVGSVQVDKRDRLLALCHDAVKEDHADVLILAGGPLAGLGLELADRLPVPVVDGTTAAVRHAETLVALRPGKAPAGSTRQPSRKASAGLPPALARLMTGGNTAEPG